MQRHIPYYTTVKTTELDRCWSTLLFESKNQNSFSI